MTSIWSFASAKITAPLAEILPKVSMNAVSFSPPAMDLVASPTSRITSKGARISPAAFLVLTPAISASLPSVASTFFMSVPADVPLIPLLASNPAIAANSSRETPAALAKGAAILNASPSSSTEVFEAVAVAVNTSATCPISFAAIPNAPETLVAMSAAMPSSRAPAFARSRTAGIPARIFSVLNPAMPSICMPWATSWALNVVVAPSSFAFATSFVNSAPVAPVTALTADICDSKVANVLTANPNPAAAGAAAASSGRPTSEAERPNAVNWLCSRFSPPVTPSLRYTWTKASPALIAPVDATSPPCDCVVCRQSHGPDVRLAPGF